MKHISADNRQRLWAELEKYERDTEMTETERAALHEWVRDGNSVHENGSMACQEGGRPSDFLDVYREEEAIRQELERLSPRERENYIARLRGEDTIDNLREDIQELFFRMNIYERALRQHGLLAEAEQMYKEAKERSSDDERQLRKWMDEHPEEELPFQ